MSRLPSVLAATVAAAIVSVSAPAHAAEDTWSVPGDARITIKGHGYGHGHGMSQYGAEGAARQGLSTGRSWRSTTRAPCGAPAPAR